ncbi:HAD family phosphatase [Acidianus sp. RZ1]|uniref:HAD family hydrolase n=1 Tax=Acidianus sp. RZ1 TaxID=1540082 RepID=UPI0014915C2B|nr:HAD family phosphatase [Acidianus sp. RZ1]NON61345.1 HAD family phosphatase [Acidianus sp. RZ1]
MNAVILDLDGTLVETAHVHNIAWEISLKEMGINIPDNLDSLMGMRTIEIARLIGGEKWKELFDRKNRNYEELFFQLAKPTPCSNELINNLTSKGVKIAVVTSSLMKSAQLSFKLLNFYPEVLVTGDQVNKGKPDPEPIIKALNIMMVTPEHTIGIGDTLQDIIAYTKAGLKEKYLIKNNNLKIKIDEVGKYGGRIIDTLCELISRI